MNKHRSLIIGCVVVFSLTLLVSCSFFTEDEPESLPQVRGALNALLPADQLTATQAFTVNPRNSALLGVHVARYVTQTMLTPVQGALNGIRAQTAIAAPETTIADPDFALLEAFAVALDVNVTDILNRSINRQEALDRYIDALRNVATRAEDRYRILSPAVENVKDGVTAQQRVVTDLQRQIKEATEQKNFQVAGELQKKLDEAQITLTEVQTNYDKTTRLVKTLDSLLTLFGQRMIALQQNREALILGVTVVETEGVKALMIIEQNGEAPRRSERDAEPFYEGLLDFSKQLEGF